MLERIHPVRTEKRGQGFEIAAFRWAEYAIRTQRAQAALSEIADAAFRKATITAANGAR